MEDKEKKVEAEKDEDLNPDDFEEGGQPKGDDKPKESQSAEKNPEPEGSQTEDEEKKRRAEFAERRRKKEAEEKAERERKEREAQIRKEAAEQAELGLITKNPYTGKPIKDTYDLEIYKIQKAIDERGGDTTRDLADEFAERERKKAAQVKKEAEEAKKATEANQTQIAELRKAHPEVNTAELAKDPDFMELAYEKEGRWTLLEVFEENERRKAAKKKKEDDSKAEELAKKQKQPRANGNGSNQLDDKIQKAETYEEYQQRWKEKYKQ